MKFKFSIILVFVFQITGFSQKVDKNGLLGEWKFMNSYFGGDTIRLIKMSDTLIHKGRYYIINFENNNNFFTSKVSIPKPVCDKGGHCFPEGQYQLKENQIEFLKITEGRYSSIKCGLPKKMTYQIIESADTLLMLKKI
ncbi:MAG: hypothetical protein IPJ81_12845 [Chitinophagaceae bacterium]|nr:hypothetical protein [Chitinophagaceae bacterium]